LKDQISRYEHKIACQQQHSNELNDTLQSCRTDLANKDETVFSLSRDKDALQNSLQKTEKDLSSRIAELEHDLRLASRHSEVAFSDPTTLCLTHSPTYIS